MLLVDENSKKAKQMEEEKQSVEVKQGVDIDLNGNEILDITFDRGDYLQPFEGSYQQLDFFSVEELIKGYNAKPAEQEKQLTMIFENDNYEEESMMAVPYELRTIETEFRKTGYTIGDHEEFEHEGETVLRQDEEQNDMKKEEKESELEEISTEEDSEMNKIGEIKKEGRGTKTELSGEENDQEQKESQKLLSDKRIHQLLLELMIQL